jgi:hypothetical protein
MNHPEPHTTLGTQDTEQLKKQKKQQKKQTKQTNKQTKKNTKTKQYKKQNEEKKPTTLNNMDPTRKPGMSSGTHKRLAVET